MDSVKLATNQRQMSGSSSFPAQKPTGQGVSSYNPGENGPSKQQQLNVRTFSGLQPEKYAILKRKQAGGGVHIIDKIKNLSFWPPAKSTKKPRRSSQQQQQGNEFYPDVDRSSSAIPTEKRRDEAIKTAAAMDQEPTNSRSSSIAPLADWLHDLQFSDSNYGDGFNSTASALLAHQAVTAGSGARGKHEDRFIIDASRDTNNNGGQKSDIKSACESNTQQVARVADARPTIITKNDGLLVQQQQQQRLLDQSSAGPVSVRGGGESLDLFRQKLKFFRTTELSPHFSDASLQEGERATNQQHQEQTGASAVEIDGPKSIWATGLIKTGAVNQISKQFAETKPASIDQPDVVEEEAEESDRGESFDNQALPEHALSRGRLAYSLRRSGNKLQKAAGKRFSYSVDSKSEYHFSERAPQLKSGVVELAHRFEKGDMDRIGPLKLYHAQAYKRELEKIFASNKGDVLYKAQIYDVSPARSQADASDTSTLIQINQQEQRPPNALAKRQDSFMKAVLRADTKNHRSN